MMLASTGVSLAGVRNLWIGLKSWCSIIVRRETTCGAIADTTDPLTYSNPRPQVQRRARGRHKKELPPAEAGRAPAPGRGSSSCSSNYMRYDPRICLLS